MMSPMMTVETMSSTKVNPVGKREEEFIGGKGQSLRPTCALKLLTDNVFMVLRSILEVLSMGMVLQVGLKATCTRIDARPVLRELGSPETLGMEVAGVIRVLTV